MSDVKITDSLGDQLRKKYPSNSKVTSPDSKAKDPEKLTKVVSSAVSLKKDSVGKKFMKAFFSEGFDYVKQDILNELVIPGIKTGILVALERTFFGRGTGYGYNPWGWSNVNYNKQYYQQKPITVTYKNVSQTYGGPQVQVANPNNYGLKPVIFQNRQDAENVLRGLMSQIAKYNEATVMQYYDLCDLDSEFTDNKWGWQDLGNARIYPVRGGCCLELPPPIPLE